MGRAYGYAPRHVAPCARAAGVRARALRGRSRGPRRARRLAAGRRHRGLLVRRDGPRPGAELGEHVAAAAARRRRALVVAGGHVAAGLGRARPRRARRAAAAGALQYRMLVEAGIPSSLAGIGIGVASIVLLATLAALPVLAIPAVLLGVAIPERLWQAGLLGIVRVRRAARDRGDAAGLRPRGRAGSGGVDPDRHGGCGRASRRPPTCRNAGATSATSSGRRSDGAGGRPSRAARGAGCSTG